MQVEFLGKFGKDLDKLNQPHVKKAIQKIIIRVEQANSLNEIPQVKKLAGHKSAYRIRGVIIE
jgi:mRNA-degrading endonuclease RelE of RelBE toxin-antitoxin system